MNNNGENPGKVLDSPYDNVYWLSRMLINTDKQDNQHAINNNP